MGGLRDIGRGPRYDGLAGGAPERSFSGDYRLSLWGQRQGKREKHYLGLGKGIAGSNEELEADLRKLLLYFCVLLKNPLVEIVVYRPGDRVDVDTSSQPPITPSMCWRGIRASLIFSRVFMKLVPLSAKELPSQISP
jgi:hypothetical protein